MCCRWFTGLTNAFSKKLENPKAALGLYFFWYNSVRIHRSLRVIPAMEAGITDRAWGLKTSSPTEDEDALMIELIGIVENR